MTRGNADTERRLTTLAEKLLAINFTRKALLEQLANLDAESAQFQREYNLTLNDCAPISVLPEEVLSWIFKLTHSMLQDENPPIELVLSQVTHYWRNIAIDTPKLWSRIDRLKVTSLYLQRSKAVQFTLDLLAQSTCFSIGNEGDNDEVVREALEQLPLHLKRCKSLKFHCHDQREMALFMPYLAASSGPKLLSLDLLCNSSQNANTEYIPVFHEAFPALRNLKLSNVHLKPFYTNLGAVATLDFTATKPLGGGILSELFNALNFTPSLKTFNFNADGHHLSIWQPNFHVSLPSLQSLSIFVTHKSGSVMSAILRIITAPSLTHLNLNDVHSSALAGFPEGAVPDTAPKFPLLHTLELRTTYIDPIRVIEAFPTVQALVFDQFADGIDLLLSFLISMSTSWPLLCTLTIPSGSSLEGLEKLSLARESMGFPIKKFKLYPRLLKQVNQAANLEGGSVFKRIECASLSRSPP